MRQLTGLLALLLLASPAAQSASDAGKVEVSAMVNVRDGVYSLNARIIYPLDKEVRAALTNGAVVRFTLHAVIEKQRRYWLDDELVDVTLRRELAWNAVSQRYILRDAHSGEQDSHATLEAALAAAGEVRGWQIAAQPKLQRDATYEIRVRAGYRSSRLPDALLPLAFWSDGWVSKSEWKSWTLPR